jgi:hypothetical protein
MTKSSDVFAKARRELLMEYERGAQIDIARWISRFPDCKDDLLSYWMLLRSTPRLQANAKKLVPPRDDVAHQALRRAVEAISLGRGWLEDSVEPESEAQTRLGARLEAVRRSPNKAGGSAPAAFRKSAVYTWVVVALSEGRGSVSRLAAQKVTHLLERGLELKLFEEHKQMPLGPYDSTARYKTAEPIAKKKGWIEVSGTQLIPGATSDAAAQYARSYVRSPSVAQDFVKLLARLTDSQLETWATVEWVARDLIAERKPFDARSIRDRLATIRTWSPKLKKPNFSEEQVSEAVAALVRLRIVDTDLVDNL